VEFPIDLVIEAPSRRPVAVYLAMSEQRVLEAAVAQMAVTYESKADCSVIALLEKDSSVTRRMRQRASNRLTAMPISRVTNERRPSASRVLDIVISND
jgi:hypothetical protein